MTNSERAASLVWRMLPARIQRAATIAEAITRLPVILVEAVERIEALEELIRREQEPTLGRARSE